MLNTQSANKKKLKILFLPAWYPSKENHVAGIFIKEHAKAVSLYNDVVVIYGEVYEKKLKKNWQIVSDKTEDGIRTIRIAHKKYPIPRAIYFFIYLWTAGKAFKKLLEEGWKPDIIHVHVYSLGLVGVILGWIYKIPVIITEHSTNIATHSLTFLRRIMAKFVMSKAKIILPVSDDLRQAIEIYYGIKNRFYVIPNVVNLNTFYSLADCRINQEGHHKKRILSVAILKPRKGIPFLLEALSRIKSDRQDFILDIVGDGPSRKEYEELTENLGIKDMVKFHGQKSKEEIVKFMRNCNFFVLPSLYENFGVVYIEAMACGKPVIGTSAGGPKEIITKDVGILVPSKDIDRLKEVINFMLDHYQNYSPEKISQYVKKNFSYEIIGKKLDKIYRNISGEVFEKYSVGNSGYKIKIKNEWRVLDVGSGHNPHPRADVILDKYIQNNRERSGKPIKVIGNQRFVQGDVCRLPFKDKSFDYIIASHIAEHVDDPKAFCQEIIRVGKAGYIETPSKFAEMMLGEIFHKWYVYVKNGILFFEKKSDPNPSFLRLLGNIFYAIYYVNVVREGKPTLRFRNQYLRSISNQLVYYFLRGPWVVLKRITYTCFEWRGEFKHKIINKKQ